MNKTGKYSRFTTLVLLICLAVSGCASFSDLSGGADSAEDGGSSSAQAAGGSSSAQTAGGSSSAQAAGGSSSAQAAGGSSSAQTAGGSSSTAAGGNIKNSETNQNIWTKSVGFVKNAGQKIWTESVGFIKDAWLSLLIILVICTSCTISCKKAKQKIKKLVKRRVVITSIILTSLGLIYGVLHFGILRHDGNFKNFKLEHLYKPAAYKNNNAKFTYAYVNENQLNLRAGPSPTHKIISELPRNTRLEVMSSSGTWWKIRHGKTEGYVNSKYLRKE